MNRFMPEKKLYFNNDIDVILYESSTLIHGRPLPLNGDIFANFFIHFAPSDWENQLNSLLISK